MRSFLTADLVGFQSFDYARHFLSCCARQLGVEHEMDRGSIAVKYFGRKVYVTISPTGVQVSIAEEFRENRSAPKANSLTLSASSSLSVSLLLIFPFHFRSRTSCWSATAGTTPCGGRVS